MPAGKPAEGFTLIELMVVIVIVAVFAGLAAPSMRELIAASKLRGASSEFYASLLAARSEAVKRRANAVIEPVGATWSTGWTVKTGGTVLLTVDPLPSEVTVQVNVTADATTPITYAMNGRISSTDPIDIIFYNASMPIQARCVGMNPSGLPRMRQDTNRVGTDGCN